MRLILGACRIAGHLTAVVVALGATSLGHATPASDAPRAALAVRVTPQFFAPSLGQTVEIAVEGTSLSDLTLEILDRDRFVIRTLKLADDPRIAWNGKDESGDVVPDEAYALRMVRNDPDGSRTVLYDPSADFAPEPLDVKGVVYDRRRGILKYTLPVPARVHILAVQSRPNPETGEPEGPVLKTVVDGEPRTAGAIVETWNGRDVSSTVYVPDLPGFAISVEAIPLPESAFITVGNRDEGFFEYAHRTRASAARKPRRLARQTHAHAGLNAFEDRSPALNVTPEARFDDQRAAWVVEERLPLRVEIELATAPYFLRQPSELLIFVDAEEVLRMGNPDNPARATALSKHLEPGDHQVVVNWVSELGPVGVQVVQIHVPETGNRIAEGRK